MGSTRVPNDDNVDDDEVESFLTTALGDDDDADDDADAEVEATDGARSGSVNEPDA